MAEPDSFYPAKQPSRLERPLVPFAWSSLSPTDTALFLEDLDLWVGWLVERYHLDRRTVPECWREHPELIEELSALHLAWQGSFALTANHDAPLVWHEHFANARQRIAELVARTGCRPDSHRRR
jgi:hypothetical protein